LLPASLYMPYLRPAVKELLEEEVLVLQVEHHC